MRPKSQHRPESVAREIKRNTRRRITPEAKIRIVREGIAPSMYYKWSKGFLEAGKRQLNGDTKREATSDDVVQLRQENEQLKQLVAELSLSNRILKKSLSGLE